MIESKKNFKGVKQMHQMIGFFYEIDWDKIIVVEMA